MKFTKINNNGVKCDEGFVVQSMDRNEMEYREGDRRLKVYVENWSAAPVGRWSKPGEYGIDFMLSRAEHWEPPHDNELISEEKREQIKKRLIAAMNFWGYKYNFS